MFDFFRGFRSVLPEYAYDNPEQLIANLGERVLGSPSVMTPGR